MITASDIARLEAGSSFSVTRAVPYGGSLGKFHTRHMGAGGRYCEILKMFHFSGSDKVLRKLSALKVKTDWYFYNFLYFMGKITDSRIMTEIICFCVLGFPIYSLSLSFLYQLYSPTSGI